MAKFQGILLLGGHRYISASGFCHEPGSDEASPLEVANCEVIDEALATFDLDDSMPYLALTDWNWRHAVETKTQKELAEWIADPTCSSYRNDPDDLKVFLTDEPPEVAVCTATNRVYVLEDSKTPIAELLAAYTDAFVLDEERWGKVQDQMTQEAWDSFGYEWVVEGVPGLSDMSDILPWLEPNFDEWYWAACGAACQYPEWSGAEVHFPTIGGSSWPSLNAEGDLWEWVDEHLWATVCGRSEEAELALTLIAISASTPPRDVLHDIIDHARQVIHAYGTRPRRAASSVSWKSVGYQNVAPYPEVTWYARHILLSGAGGLFK